MIRLFLMLLFCTLTVDASACALKDSSVVNFVMFSTQTIIPITKKDFQGAKLVIKNSFFKKLINSASKTNNEAFFENIRMKVTFNKKVYYINQHGVIEVDKSLIGKLDKSTLDHLDLGYDLYEWKTCRPLNEVLPEMYKEMMKHQNNSSP